MTRRGGGQLGVALGLAALLAGCAGRLREARAFPAIWPGSQPLSEDAPTVSMVPIQREAGQGEVRVEGKEGLPTAAVLSALFIKYLHVNGVNAVLEEPDAATARYTLSCATPQLGYTVQEGMPSQRLYRAKLACTLRDEQTQAVVWERSLTQDYEQTLVFDLFTQLPPQPHQYDRVLYRECIVPLWDAMAASVATVVVSRQQLSQPHPDEPARQIASP